MHYIQKHWGKKAKKQEYKGFRYDSGFEAQYAMFLDSELKANKIKSYDRQVNLDLVVNGYRVCQYKIDFIVYHHDNTTEYVEVKGYPGEVWKLKWKLFEALYTDKPDVKLTIIQQGNFKPPKLRKIKK